jgi:catalase
VGGECADIKESRALWLGFDLNDPTKIVPVEFVPITPIGKLVLNRKWRNHFAETEAAMVCCLLPNVCCMIMTLFGIGFSDDPRFKTFVFPCRHTAQPPWRAQL